MSVFNCPPNRPKVNANPLQPVRPQGPPVPCGPSSPRGQSNLPEKARKATPIEPILIPKLRIYFADFPYLHCSIDQRLFTSETCCGYGYDVAPDSTEVPPWGFQGPATGLGTLREPQSFAEISLLHPLSGRTPSRLPATLQRKENSSPA